MWIQMCTPLALFLVLASVAPCLAETPAISSAIPTQNKPAVSDTKAVHGFLQEVEKTYASSRQPGEKKAPSEKGVWWIPERWCVKRLAYPKNQVLDRCIVREVGQRRAAVITSVKECGPEDCDADYFIISGRSGVRKSTLELEGGLIVSADSRSFFMGDLVSVPPDGSPMPTAYKAHLLRVDFETLVSRVVANCTVPILSPSGRWIVCRDVEGHVHRVSRDGRKSHLVHRINLGGKRISGDGHIGLHITPAKFLRDGRLRIETLTTDEPHVEIIKWSVPTP